MITKYLTTSDIYRLHFSK